LLEKYYKGDEIELIKIEGSVFSALKEGGIFHVVLEGGLKEVLLIPLL